MTGGARGGLERLLHVLPAAAREGGADLTELAEALDTTARRIVDDLEELTARSYYHPGAWLDDVQILVDPDRVTVHRAPGFERPSKLTPMETLCLALALRGTAAAARIGAADDREYLLERAEGFLATRMKDSDAADVFATPDRDPDPAGIREVLITAARLGRPCAIRYLKAAEAVATNRVIHPYVAAHAEGAWYTIGHCTREGGVRVFRTDRILAAQAAEGSFEIPSDFDPAAFLEGGRVFLAGDERPLRVRYSRRIARWVRERARWEPETLEQDTGDGTLVVRHRLADPHWAVGHVLQYGPDAEVLEPEDVRALVVEVAEGLAG